MSEIELRALLHEVKIGRLGRRAFIRTALALGLTAPLAQQMLAGASLAQAPTAPAGPAPTRRGGGGRLRLLWWQAPTLLNSHFATGTKDEDACHHSSRKRPPILTAPSCRCWPPRSPPCR